jgi:signal transduction histidine kinase
LSFKSALAGYLPARFIVAGHISLMIGLAIYLFSVSGFLEYSKLITHITHVAIGMQAVFFGLAFYTKQNWSASNQSAARLEVIKKTRENQTLQSELSKQQKQLYNAVLQAQETERARIAKDLHDGVGQTLAAVKMISSQLIFSNPDLQNNVAATNSMELLDNACNEVRQISHQMMPHNLIKFGLKSGLEELFEKTFQGSNIVLEYQFTNLKLRYSQSIEIGIYRIVQEIISNMIKHSACKKAFIDIIENKDHLIIIAEDDGKGFEYNENTSLGAGLGNIKFRVHALSASLIIETKPQNGCVYRINIPLIKI